MVTEAASTRQSDVNFECSFTCTAGCVLTRLLGALWCPHCTRNATGGSGRWQQDHDEIVDIAEVCMPLPTAIRATRPTCERRLPGALFAVGCIVTIPILEFKSKRIRIRLEFLPIFGFWADTISTILAPISLPSTHRTDTLH